MYHSARNPASRAAVDRVLVDGVDVTLVCFEADDERGWARCFMWKGYPNPPVAPVEFMLATGAGRVDDVELRGRVEVVLKPGVERVT